MKRRSERLSQAVLENDAPPTKPYTGRKSNRYARLPHAPHLLACRHARGPPLLGLAEEAGLLVAGGSFFERMCKRSDIVVLGPPHRQLEDGDGEVQEADALAKTAAHVSQCLGEANKVGGNLVVVRPICSLREGNGALEHRHGLFWSARPQQRHTELLRDDSKLRILWPEPHADVSGQGVAEEGDGLRTCPT